MFDASDWWMLALLALPLGVVGLALRARGRRGLQRAAAGTARRKLRDVQPGVVAFAGTWRALAGDRGIVEDDGAAALIDRGAGAPAIGDGARVLCHGVARGDAPDPRGGGYRGSGRLPVVDCSGAGDFVTTELDRDARVERQARRASLAGMVAVALSVAMVAATLALYAQTLSE